MRYLLLLLLVSCASIDTTPPLSTRPPETDIATEVLKPGEVIAVARTPFSTTSTLDWVQRLVKVGNCVANNEDFIKEVAAFRPYTFTKDSSEVVAIGVKSLKAKVVTYKTKYPYSAAIATTYKGDNESVYLNTRRNPRPMPEMINTIFHEGLHLIGYSHGDNYPNGKESSVNYRVGSLAEKYSTLCN